LTRNFADDIHVRAMRREKATPPPRSHVTARTNKPFAFYLQPIRVWGLTAAGKTHPCKNNNSFIVALYTTTITFLNVM